MIRKQIGIDSPVHKHINRVLEKYGNKAQVRFEGVPYFIVDAHRSSQKNCIDLLLKPV